MDKTQMILEETRHSELIATQKELAKILEKLGTLLKPKDSSGDIQRLIAAISQLAKELKVTVNTPPLPTELVTLSKDLKKPKNFKVEVVGRDSNGNIKDLNITQI